MSKAVQTNVLTNCTAAFSASALFYAFSRETLLELPFVTVLIPFGSTYLGYSFIHFLDDKNKKWSWIDGVLTCLSILFILPLFWIRTTVFDNLPYFILALTLWLWYIKPIFGIRLRDQWWSKSLTITAVWIIQSCLIYKSVAFDILLEKHLAFLSISSILCLAACWAYDISESNWGRNKIVAVKITISSIYFAIGMYYLVNFGIKKGVVLFLILLFILQITRLKKTYSYYQNPIIDLLLGLIFISL